MASKTEHVFQFQQRETAEADGGGVGKEIGGGDVVLHRALQGGNGFAVKTGQQFRCRRRAQDFIEKNLQIFVGHDVQAQGRFAHFADPFAERIDVFGAKISVQTEAHFEFVNWLGGKAGVENLVEPFERVMIAFEPGDAPLD